MGIIQNLIDRLGFVGGAVAAALLLIAAWLVILHPELLSWLVGLSMVLAGVALGALLYSGRGAGPR